MNKLEEHDIDEWASISLGYAQYDINVFFMDGELCATIYPLKKDDNGYLQCDTLNPVASGKLDIFSLKRIKENL